MTDNKTYRGTSTFFVSQAYGSDTHTGDTADAPFCTVERALQAVRELRERGIERPLTVAIVGDYFLNEPIHLKNIHDLHIVGYGENARIVGGVKIEGWTRGEFNRQACLCARLPASCPDRFTDLYVNGERARVTRFPTEESKRALRILDADDAMRGAYTPGEHMSHTSKWFQFDKSELCELHSIEDAILHYNHYWIDEHTPIEGYDAESGVVVMKYNSRFSAGVSYEENREASPLCYLTNVPDLFCERGHWYLDRKARTVYYIPTEEGICPDEIEAFAPVSDKLFCLTDCTDVSLCNLELTSTSGDYVSTKHYVPLDAGIDGFASDIQSACGAPGAITIENSTGCSIRDCYIHGVGIYAIELLCGVRYARIENNHIYDICAGAIRIAGANAAQLCEDPSLASGDCLIRKNHIHGIGRRYFAGCGILVMDAHHCEISENEIHDTEYSGISVGWVWGYAESATYACTIRANHIYDIGHGKLSDLGAIYLLGKQRGTVVCDNLIHDVSCYCYGAWGIYLDEGSSFVRVEGNTVYNTKNECFHLHYGSHNTVRNNRFIAEQGSCIRITRYEPHDQVLFSENVLVSGGSPIYGEIPSPKTISNSA